MRFAFAPMMTIAAVGACTLPHPSVPFPTYEYVGIDLGAVVQGDIRLSGQCLLIDPIRDGRVAPPVILVMPLGTRLVGNSIMLPAENGGATLRLGERARFQGGYNTIDGEQSWNRNPGGCEGSSFLVNRTYP